MGGEGSIWDASVVRLVPGPGRPVLFRGTFVDGDGVELGTCVEVPLSSVRMAYRRWHHAISRLPLVDSEPTLLPRWRYHVVDRRGLVMFQVYRHDGMLHFPVEVEDAAGAAIARITWPAVLAKGAAITDAAGEEIGTTTRPVVSTEASGPWCSVVDAGGQEVARLERGPRLILHRTASPGYSPLMACALAVQITGRPSPPVGDVIP